MPTETELLRWIPLLPLIGTAVGIAASCAGRPEIAKKTSPAVVLLAFVVSLVTVARLWGLPAGGSLVDPVYTWIGVGPLQLDLAFRVDALTSVMILIITGV